MKIILLFAIVVLSCSMTFDQLNQCNNECSTSEFKLLCTFDANMAGKSFPLDPACALDVQKRNTCLGFQGCMLGKPTNETVPFICWHCITNSPFKTDLYKQYHSCMKQVCQNQPKLQIL